MAELPLDQAVPRFKANEDRLDTFVNSATGYTTSGGVSVQSIQQFLASIGSNGIDFVDNAKARFGTGNDLEIYHSGSGSFIRDTGTGDLTIDGSAISIQTASAERISVSASGIDVTGTVEFDGLSGTGAVTITDIADEDNMASNSATKLATQQSIKAYVDAQVGTADTLSEVLGLGNTTGGTDIAVSANDDITFTDSSKAIFGAGSDLQIYHDASNSYIKEAGTGNLFIDATSLRLRTGAGTETYLTADGNGSVDLYYDNAKKLETTSSGIDVLGNARITASSTRRLDFQNTSLADTGEIASLQWDNDANFTIQGRNSASQFKARWYQILTTDTDGRADTHVFYTDNSAQRMSIDATGIDVTGTVEFDGLSGTGSVTVTDILDEDDMTSDSATALATQQSIKAYVDANAGGGGLPTTGGTMTGDILFNDGVKAKYGTSSDLQIYHDGSNSYISDTGTGDVIVKGQYIRLQDEIGTNLLTADGNDSVSLYFGGASKLATTSTGIGVTGNVNSTKSGGSTLTLENSITSISANELIGGIDFKGNDTSEDGNEVLAFIRANALDTTPDSCIRFGTLQNNGGVDDVVTERMRLDNYGRLGIGTTSPNHELHIESTSPTIRLVDTDNNNTIDISQSGSACYIDFDNNVRFRNLANAERLRIDSNGIDVTGSTNTTGTSGTLQWSAGTAGQKLAIYGYDNSTFYHRLDSGNATNYQWGAYDNIPIYTITNNTIRTTLLGNGNFGIGTAAPADLLDVRGDGADTYIRIGSDTVAGNDAGRIGKIDSSTDFVIQSSLGATASNTIFKRNTTAETMRIDSTGNVGIGTAAPSVKLQTTVANASTEAIRITNDADSVRTHMLPAEIQAHNSNLTLSANDGGFSTIIKAAGAERMRANSTGIDVTGELRTTGSIYLSESGNADSPQVVWESSGYGDQYIDNYQGNLRVVNSGAQQFTIKQGGNVGIGTAAPTAKMHLFTDGIDQSMFSAQADLGVQNRNLTLKSPVSDSSTQPFRWQTSNSILWEIDVTESKSMNLNSVGNLGVGTLSPSYKIDARGAANADVGIQVKASGTGDVDAELRLDAADTGEALVRYARDGTTRAVSEYTNSNEWNFTTYNDDKIDFQPNSTNVLRLTDDNIYAYKTVNVTGDLTVSSTIEVGSLTPNQDGAIEVGVIALGTPAISSTTSSTGLMNHIIFDNPNGAVGKINTLNSATSYLTSSDYRLKTDVQAMTGSIDRLKALRPVNFEWIVDGTRIDGFLAHEAQEVVPEAVDGEKDAMRDQDYVESEATGDIYTPAVEATYETIQVELTPAVEAVYETVTVEISPAVEATYDDDGNELTPAVEAITEEQEQLVTPAVEATYEEQQQELTPAVDEVIHSADVVEPDELEKGQLWRETTEKVMATRQVPDYQGIDQSKIVPLLTSALQDAIAKIEALETRLEALEA